MQKRHSPNINSSKSQNNSILYSIIFDSLSYFLSKHEKIVIVQKARVGHSSASDRNCVGNFKNSQKIEQAKTKNNFPRIYICIFGTYPFPKGSFAFQWEFLNVSVALKAALNVQMC